MNNILQHKINYIFTILLSALISFNSCQESIEDRAVRDAKEYTSKFCPTPPENEVITDSIVFDKKIRTQIYYMTFTGNIDNEIAINENKKQIEQALLETVRNNTSLNAYKKAGFNFRYVCRSQKEKNKTLLDITYTAKEY